MSIAPRIAALSLGLALCLAVSVAPRVAGAVSESVIVVAGPLAQHYGVSGSDVTSLLRSGVSLEDTTRLLLIKESSGKTFDQVTSTYREQGEDIKQTADQLGVAAEKYSPANVEAAIDRARGDVAASASEKASEKAAEATGKAVDSVLGGMRR